MLTDTILPISMSRSLLHEFGHVLHSLISETELQHLSGTRGAVDFAEFPSNLFEHFTPVLMLSPAHSSSLTPTTLSCNFAHLQALQLLLHALMDQAFYSFFPSPKYSTLYDRTGEESATHSGEEEGLSAASATRTSSIEAELRALREGIDAAYGRHEWLLTPESGLRGTTVCDLVGKPHLARFEHLVHYGGSYFCYLFCRCVVLYE